MQFTVAENVNFLISCKKVKEFKRENKLTEEVKIQ